MYLLKAKNTYQIFHILEQSDPSNIDVYCMFQEFQLFPLKGLTNGDQSKTDAVRSKFEVLKAGYEAAGAPLDRNTVFDEAAKLVLGDAMAKADLDKKTKAAKKRSRQRISRASGHRAASVGSGDVMKDIAAEIDAKFYA